MTYLVSGGFFLKSLQLVPREWVERAKGGPTDTGYPSKVISRM